MGKEQILAAVKINQPALTALPTDLAFNDIEHSEVVKKFVETVTLIGGSVIEIDDLSQIDNYIEQNYNPNQKVVSPIADLACYLKIDEVQAPHWFADTEFAVCLTSFAVAENGAVWINEVDMGIRALPFITQHLGLIVKRETIVANMHQAYEVMLDYNGGFGAFIAGPSKTADIEQSLVLGAHGARSLIIFLLN